VLSFQGKENKVEATCFSPESRLRLWVNIEKQRVSAFQQLLGKKRVETRFLFLTFFLEVDSYYQRFTD